MTNKFIKVPYERDVELPVDFLTAEDITIRLEDGEKFFIREKIDKYGSRFVMVVFGERDETEQEYIQRVKTEKEISVCVDFFNEQLNLLRFHNANTEEYTELLLPLAEHIDIYSDRGLGDLEFSLETTTAFQALCEKMAIDYIDAAKFFEE